MRVVMLVLRHCGSGPLRLPDGPDGARLSTARVSSKVDRHLRRTLQPLRICHCWIMFLVQKVSLDSARQSLMVEPSSHYSPPTTLPRTVLVTEPACVGGEERCSECSGLQAKPRGSDPVSQTRFEAGVIREYVCHLLLSSRMSSEWPLMALQQVRHLHCQD